MFVDLCIAQLNAVSISTGFAALHAVAMLLVREAFMYKFIDLAISYRWLVTWLPIPLR
jgi:hypothetical protein